MLTSYIVTGETIGIACNQIFKAGMNNIGKGLQLATQHPYGPASLDFVSGITQMLIAEAILIQKLAHTKESSISNLDGTTHLMLCALATGRFELVEPFHQAIFTGIHNGYGVSDGHNLPIGTTFRYAAFGLTIIGDWLGKPLDLDKHALPRDPAWGQLVAHWREPDPDKLAPILVAACDTHVERIALTSRELDSGNFEFGSPFEAVYPAEILAILNLRRSLGLTNPSPIEHPLMQTPYARLTCPPGMRFEPDELLLQFLAAVCKHDPAAMPDGLYEAVLQTNSAN
ncbi:hypothetical protein RIN61_00010 [Pseudomonas inefficax]|uniref:hypothetical protein n=2 Tax=Pseudomonas TaxID=286 RepID=UPI0028BE7B94|nr:hypothetical protein [Pseudomonas inefficax]WNN39718.1 hypothetical protein RIN61_26630 [Pseudomonas inefficax]WNN39726.1 hypothetical protein RIN61_00010 [Pseudomonas inefficax]